MMPNRSNNSTELSQVLLFTLYKFHLFYNLSDSSEWSRSGFFVNLLKSECSQSVVSNFKIETKNDASVNCDFNVTTLIFQSLKPEYDIGKTFGVGVRNKSLRSSLSCTPYRPAHFWSR